MSIFDDQPRTDWSPARHNESHFAFLSRSPVPFFGETRDLLEIWLVAIPPEHHAPLLGALRCGDDAQFESAVWEMHLHEAYRRSGHAVSLHPAVPGVGSRPDFLIEGPNTRFYLEAVRVGRAPAALARDSRLADVYAVLDTVNAVQFTLMMSSYCVGPAPLPGRRLRSDLQNWLDSLDPAEVANHARASGAVGFAALPRHVWSEDGWRIEFHAMPLMPEAADRGLGLVGAWGPGEAKVVDNVSRVRAVLDSKANKYGTPDLPLVIAVLANTEYPTKDYEIEQALYGVSSARPTADALAPRWLFEDGHWLTRRGWRRGHAPQVITAARLQPWSVIRTVPRLWTTAEADVQVPEQPTWVARADVSGAEVQVGPNSSLAGLFGLPEDWLDREPEWPT